MEIAASLFGDQREYPLGGGQREYPWGNQKALFQKGNGDFTLWKPKEIPMRRPKECSWGGPREYPWGGRPMPSPTAAVCSPVGTQGGTLWEAQGSTLGKAQGALGEAKGIPLGKPCRGGIRQ